MKQKLKNFLCKIELHYWDRLEDGTRKCPWCKLHEEVDPDEDIEPTPFGGQGISWRKVSREDINPQTHVTDCVNFNL